MTPRARGWLLVALLVALIIGVIIWARQPDPIPPEILSPRVDSALAAEAARGAVLDSVAAVNRARDDSLRVEQAARELRVAVLVREAATQERRAHTLADSARALGDTVGVAWATAEAWRVRGDSLTVALVVSDSARRAEHARAEMWRMAAASESDSRARWATIARDLREAVDRAAAQNRCRIIGAIPCPSRTVVAVLSAATVGAGALYLDR